LASPRTFLIPSRGPYHPGIDNQKGPRHEPGRTERRFELKNGRVTNGREYFYDLHAWEEFWA
jgi:hypothetical protein